MFWKRKPKEEIKREVIEESNFPVDWKIPYKITQYSNKPGIYYLECPTRTGGSMFLGAFTDIPNEEFIRKQINQHIQISAPAYKELISIIDIKAWKDWQ